MNTLVFNNIIKWVTKYTKRANITVNIQTHEESEIVRPTMKEFTYMLRDDKVTRSYRYLFHTSYTLGQTLTTVMQITMTTNHDKPF